VTAGPEYAIITLKMHVLKERKSIKPAAYSLIT